jgi:hypothetical protein
MFRLPDAVLCCLLGFAESAGADLVVIANPDSGVDQLSRDAVVDIFMGRYQKLPSGVTALPVDQAPAKAAFYKSLLDKELPEIQSYWARLVFSGQGSPPRQMATAAEVIDVVANNRGAVGYVDSTEIDRRVQVVLALPAPAGVTAPVPHP